MTIRTEPWPAGTPCWADVSTPDIPAAQEFYSSLFGWEYPAGASEQYDGYVVGAIDGHDAAGIGPLPEGHRPYWTLYFATDTLEATSKAAATNGGGVIVPLLDFGSVGRMAVLTDPAGAAFGIWESGDRIGSQHVNAPGGLAWEDLRSTDPDAARAFYRELFDYEYKPLPAVGPDYTEVSFDGQRAIGGIGGMMDSPAGTPSHWLLYFAVTNVDAAVATVTKRGGSVLRPALDTPFGRMAEVADPAGAAFVIAESQPDAGS